MGSKPHKRGGLHKGVCAAKGIPSSQEGVRIVISSTARVFASALYGVPPRVFPPFLLLSLQVVINLRDTFLFSSFSCTAGIYINLGIFSPSSSPENKPHINLRKGKKKNIVSFFAREMIFFIYLRTSLLGKIASIPDSETCPTNRHPVLKRERPLSPFLLLLLSRRHLSDALAMLDVNLPPLFPLPPQQTPLLLS